MIKSSLPFLRNPICVALDVDEVPQALSLAKELQMLAGGFKVGPRLALKMQAADWAELVSYGPLFLDCNFHDIPSTMLASVQAAFDLGATLVTVHASAGDTALRGLAELQENLRKLRPFQVLAVTVLTSETVLGDGSSVALEHKVRALAGTVLNSGLQGLVCSAKDLSLLPEGRKWVITPGIRSAGEIRHDQSRVATISEALSHGANAVVVGRPILEAPSAVLRLQQLLSEIPEGNL